VGVPRGTYTVKANASIVFGETETGDNEYVDGIVTVLPFVDSTPPSWLAERGLNADGVNVGGLRLTWSGAVDDAGSQAIGSTRMGVL